MGSTQAVTHMLPPDIPPHTEPLKRFSNVLIPKGATTDIHLISFIEEIETFLSIYIGQHISDGF